MIMNCKHAGGKLYMSPLSVFNDGLLDLTFKKSHNGILDVLHHFDLIKAGGL